MNSWIIVAIVLGLIGAVSVVAILVLMRQSHPPAASLTSEPPTSLPVKAEDVTAAPPFLPAGCLMALSGPVSGQTFMMLPPPRGIVIGRTSDNDIIVNTAMVSRHHAQVMVEGDQVVLYDRDSTNGTWLGDGRRVSRHVLKVGDRFQIGDVVFAYGVPGQPVPPPAAPAPSTALISALPAHFEGYTLLQMLGHGGMSVVYKAQAPDGTLVAIKILDAADEWIARKFIQEGNIGTALRDHPYIRIVHDLRYSQDRRPYLVMEYIEGASLRKMAGQPLPVPQVVNWIGQVCDALAYAHQRQIVHRDVKPENILVTPANMVKVTDFGIAKLTSAVTVTSDRIVGTPEYISPEQAKGEEVRPASDIYSVGVVLYELLTGQVPFPLPAVGENRDSRGAAYAVIRQHINTPPPPPSRLNPQLAHSAVEKATLKALDKDPHKRFTSAAELAQSLGYSAGASLAPLTSCGSPRLVIVAGRQRGKVIPIHNRQLIVTRAWLDPENTRISRQHAVIMQKGREWWVRDTSMNGTWVNGQRVYGEAPLTGDRLVAIADFTLQLQL